MLTKRKTGVILSYILMIAEVLSTLLLTPFIIRTLGQSEYGVYKLVGVVSTYLLLLDLYYLLQLFHYFYHDRLF